jgi:hypothetical protein
MRGRAVPNLTLSIPHQLTRDEAKRRIREQLAEAQRQAGGLLGPVEERWDGYTLDAKFAAVGQTITARAVVEERTVEVSVALPWMLAMLAGSVRKGIEEQGRKLLGHRDPGAPAS